MSVLEGPNLRLRALAGFLAERSVQTLVLVHRGVRREVHARVTDLPRELEAITQDGGEVHAPQLGLTVVFRGTDVHCTCADPAISLGIMKAIAPH